MPDITLQTSNLDKSFGGIVATRGVGIAVERGTIHAVVGPNGAGKTTLFHQLAGTLRPDNGTVHFEGVDITNLGAAERVRRAMPRLCAVVAGARTQRRCRGGARLSR